MDVSLNLYILCLLRSFVTGSSDGIDGEEDDDREDSSRMESRSVDVLVDDDNGAQLIAYSVFEQVMSTYFLDSPFCRFD